MNNRSNTTSGFVTALKWGLGGIVAWNILRPEARDEIREFLNNDIAAYERRQQEIEIQKIIQEFWADFSSKLETSITSHTLAATSAIPLATIENPLGITLSSPTMSSLSLFSEQYLERDTAWRTKIVHPSVVLILGKRGSGKSALGYRLLELLRYYVADIYVIGVPEQARKLLPEWIGIVPSLEDLPAKCIALVDEANLAYHARCSMTAKSKAMSQALNLSRQKEQTLIFISQEAGHIDKNIAGSANVLVFKELGMLQLEFDRPQLTKLGTQAKQALDSVQGNKQRWSFVYAPDNDFLGLMENELPSFWKPRLSRAFAKGPASPTQRQPKSMTLQDRLKRALELRAQGASYGVIARELGVSRGTVVNYIKGYPYSRQIPRLDSGNV
ncbi:helix-turn-helix domain-containing protein [Chloroflexota bacterium]